MRTPELNWSHIGQKGTFPVRNDQKVTGTLSRVRHAAQGTYLEFEEHHGVYQTDDSREIENAP